MKIKGRFISVAVTAGLLLFGAESALADDCVGPSPGLGGTIIAGECVINSFVARTGTFTIGEPLRITGTGRIDATGALLTGITLNVTGNVVLETPTVATGGQIEADDVGVGNPPASPITINASGALEMFAGSVISARNNVSGGSGGKITIDVGGDMILHGTSGGTPGALITAHGGPGSGTSPGGTILIQIGNIAVTFDANGVPSYTCDPTNPTGDLLMETGSSIDVSGSFQNTAGTIQMFVGHDATIRGSVLAEGNRGGPITIDACCNLLVDDTGIVSSRSRDPGADLVHIEACCVFINGLVQSTGPGHQPNTPRLCIGPRRPDKPANSTACVEIWSGTDITIDSTGTHRGEVNANTGQSGGPDGIGWIDLYANRNIFIHDGTGNDLPIPTYAVHANQFVGNGHGGLITIKALGTLAGGMVVADGLAVQASDRTNGASGGRPSLNGGITVEAKLDISIFNGASPGTIEAAGAPGGGGSQHGGFVTMRSFSGAIGAIAGSTVDVTGRVPPDGLATLTACTTIGFSAPANPPGVVTPLTQLVRNAGAPFCAAGPTIPASATYVVLPPADCLDTRCARIPPRFGKVGVKFLDVNKDGIKDPGEPGLAGFRIHLFGTDSGGAPRHDVATTAGDGSYFFGLPEPGGDYTVCEEQQAGYTQSYPNPANFPPLIVPNASPNPANETIADCTTHTDGATITPGPWGYSFHQPPSTLLENNDFGNFPNTCEKQSVREVLDPEFGRFPGNKGPDVVVNLALGQTVQGAVDNASDTNGDGYVIILVMKDATGKLGGSTTENVVVSKVYDQPFGLLACSVTVKAKDTGLAAGQIAQGAGSPGNIFVMDLHGDGSGVAGWQVNGDGRYFRNVYNTGSAVGIQFNGANNTMHNGKAEGNSGDGIQVNGKGNHIETPDSFSNAGCGIKINGNSNVVDGADVGDKNKGNGSGICVSGDLNTLNENDVFFNAGNGVVVVGNTNTLTKNVSGDAKKGNGLDGFNVAGFDNSFTENEASGNGGYGFNVSLGTVGHPNSLKKNESNTGSSGGQGENGLAEFLLGNYVKNNGGGNKADGTTVPSATKCATTFPATNATVNYSPAKACGD